MPAIIDSKGLPARMPLRWIVQNRRLAVGSSNTLVGDLEGVLDLYRWAAAVSEAPGDLDGFLAGGGQLEPRALLSLGSWVRVQTYRRNGVEERRGMGTISRRIRSIAEFLSWAADVRGRGGPHHVSPADLVLYRQRLDATFKGLKRGGSGVRPEPLTPEQDAALRDLIRPALAAGGRLAWPIRFPEKNPFSKKVQLRAWVCYLFMRDLGLRKGELLKLTMQDVDVQVGTVKVRRRTADPDPRNPAPKVKSRERALPMSEGIRQALRAYMSPTHPGRRRRGGYPYLIASGSGAPLSIAAFDDNWSRVREIHPQVGKLAPHVLRHTWAEAIAEDFLDRGKDDETTVSLLRALGGWAEGSLMPQHYVQNALGRKANEMLRQYNDAMYNRLENNG